MGRCGGTDRRHPHPDIRMAIPDLEVCESNRKGNNNWWQYSKNSYYQLMAALTKAVLYVIKLFYCLALGLERQKKRQAQNQGEKRKE